MSDVQTIVTIASVVILVIKIIVVLIIYNKRKNRRNTILPNPIMDKFFYEMEREKPIRFSSHQLSIATDNYTHFLGMGGFGAVYKGMFSNGVLIAVKVLKANSDSRIEQQFMAEVSTIGRTHHFNLVRLYGFCFEMGVRALVYEYMPNGSLDKYLFNKNSTLQWEKLHEIAIGTAKGITYLHEDCQQRIIHYDIKPGNILLDLDFSPKVADFGLAKLCNRDDTHMTMTGGRGTPGYAAPELWMPFPITHKCDVYSFGMLLFEILGRRKNLDVNAGESQEWFPRWVWKKFDRGEFEEMTVICGIEDKDREKAERMALSALWCVQYRPESRPCLSLVVKMLEGGVEIAAPPNPFPHMVDGTPPAQDAVAIWIGGFSSLSSTVPTTAPSSLGGTTPTMRRFEIERAST